MRKKSWPQLEAELRVTVFPGQMTIEDVGHDVPVVSKSEDADEVLLEVPDVVRREHAAERVSAS